MNHIRANRQCPPASAQPPSPALAFWPRAIGRRRDQRRRDRRGVLLLLMLCLLVLFAVLGVTYVLVASQFRRSTAAQPRIEQYAPDYRNQLDDAAMILFRGSTNPLSMIQDSSLLEDMYGTDAFKGTLSRAAVGSANQTTNPDQLLDLTFNVVYYASGSTITNPPGLSIIPGYYNGLVLTMTSGRLGGLSTRIVGYNPNLAGGVGPPPHPIVRVMPFEGTQLMPQSGDTFLVNGRPFNGTGAGYNSTAGVSGGLPNQVDGNFSFSPAPPFALIPNPRPEYNTVADYYLTYLASTATTPPLNDEDYDAPDFNNMHLAFMPSNPTSSSQILPSFHRPELLSYWANNPAANPSGGTPPSWNTLPLAFRSQIMLRPIGPTSGGSTTNQSGTVTNPDHPNFTGSNPNFCADLNANSTDATGMLNPTKYSWDVDNDGDGIADSVWIDIGLPVQTAADGTTYKPLVAFLCLDLDGRLNVNAHGNPAQTEADYATAQPSAPPTPAGYFAPTSSGGTTWSKTLTPDGATGTTGITQGSGYGPADINLGAPSNTTAMPASPPNTLFLNLHEYAGLMQGNKANAGAPWNGATFEGRYGETTTTPTSPLTSGYPNNPYQGWPYWVAGSVTQPAVPFAGASTSAFATSYTTGVTSVMGYVKQFETQLFPNSAANGLAPTSLGSPTDLVGRGIIGLDVRGVPLTPGMGNPQDMVNNPYLLDLSRKAPRGALATGAVDNPFTVAELERVLRTYDPDSRALPARLAALLNPTGTSTQSFRTLVTTDSYDLPSPSIGYSVDLRNLAQNATAGSGIPLVPTSVVDLLVTRLGGPNSTQLTDASLTANYPTWATVAKQVQIMLSPDLLAGKRMDINQSLGNGRDDLISGAADGVVDDLLESAQFGTSPTYGAQESAWYATTPPSAPNASPAADVSPAGPLPSQFTATTLKGFSHSNGMDINFDGHVYTDNTNGVTLNDELLARQLMARQLYVLAMLLVDQSALPLNPTAAPGTPMFLYDNTNNKYQMQYALAQWAVNCVDFRDRDSIMTPFEFDIFPFDGWGVDGVVGTADDGTAERGLVWGCERPELLITETLAWHDRRTEDLSAGGGTLASGNDTGNDFDQRLVPQDRLFIELYNPWRTSFSTTNSTSATQYTPSPAEVPGEFYYDAHGTPAAPASAGLPTGVLLGKTDTATGTSPVWRMIFVKDATQVGDPDDPRGPAPTGTAIPIISIERIVYFTKSTAVSKYPTAVGSGLTYFSGQPQTPLLPGRYAVVGSSAEMYNGQYVSRIGMDTTAAAAATPGTADTTPDVQFTRRIVLAPASNAFTTTQVSTNLNTQPADGSWPLPAEPAPLNGVGGRAAQPAVAIVIDTASTPSIAGGVAQTRSLAISDPPFGTSALNSAYPTPTLSVNNTVIDTTFPGLTGEYAYNPINGTPFDENTTYTQDYAGLPLCTNRDIPGYATCFLQRLANPQLPWNPLPTDPYFGTAGSIKVAYNANYPVNPYLTIDSMSIDLACFNGTTTTADPKAGGAYAMQFRSTQRGDQYLNTAGTLTTPGTVLPPFTVANSLLWAHEPTHTAAQTAGATTTFVANQVFKFGLQHSLGYVNPAYSYKSGSAPGKPPWFTGTAGANPAPGNESIYGGDLDPSQTSSTLGQIPPFPWLTWNNRPYVSPIELALVPKTRSSQLLATYTPAGSANPNYYTYTQPRPGNILSYPFGHLLDFFRGGVGDKATQSGVAGFDAPQLFRIFDYLQVPSPFVNTDTELDPNWVSSNTKYAGNATDNTGVKEANFGAYFHLPFNRVSNYRDPGRVNINTISDPAVWNALTNGTQMPPWWGVVASRRGYESNASQYNTSTLLLPSPALPYTMLPWPTYFGNPFRSAAGAAYTNAVVTAAVSAAIPTMPPPMTAPTGLLPRADIDVTMLRPFHPETEGTKGALFDFPQTQGATVNQTAGMYNDATRSPYFKMQNLSRMSNLLTTRSNVYAVWVTVGYFQVTPWYGNGKTTTPIVYDASHPDGYQLGQELGNDSGQIKRHRAFYLFDRTIPVGFERGVDHNVQNAILLRRFIE